MPGRNLEKVYLEHSFYHVYSRGVNKELVFRDNEDYAVFLNLFKRYLSNQPAKDNKGREYPWFHPSIELLAFCLMPNHFHALVYQYEPTALTYLFKSLITTYGMYFNRKYHRVGPVFQSRFRASLIMDDSYLQHISRYIHLNPKYYQAWPFSSLPFYMGAQTAEWVKPQRILEIFDNDQASYREFLADYEDYKISLDLIKKELGEDKAPISRVAPWK